jgi:hypothetical protein
MGDAEHGERLADSGIFEAVTGTAGTPSPAE